jgi:hypothetical protein
LLVATDELLLEELFIYVQDYLIIKRTKWVHENFILILNAVFRLDNCKKLQDYCFEAICENPLPIFFSKTFPSIHKEILFDLLKRDNLELEEVAIWDCLIKWGIEQTPELEGENSDKTEWNDEDYEELKNTLEQFIPLIRFVGISRTDFIGRVRPYKTIIPTHIYEVIEKFYYKNTLPKTTILPLRTGFLTGGKIESKIIKPILSKIITNWIDKKNTIYIRTRNDPTYKFKLIYCGSRDGISNNSFRRICKGQIASLVLIKVKNTNKIFGGYSSIGFSSLGNGYIVDDGFRQYKSSDNFIFSFENNRDTQNMKISRVVNKHCAILDYHDFGFNFGQGSLCMLDNSLYANNYNEYYENNLNTDMIYIIEEIETFIIL